MSKSSKRKNEKDAERKRLGKRKRKKEAKKEKKKKRKMNEDYDKKIPPKIQPSGATVTNSSSSSSSSDGNRIGKSHQKKTSAIVNNDEHPARDAGTARIHNSSNDITDTSTATTTTATTTTSTTTTTTLQPRPMVESSALHQQQEPTADQCVTLLLFYQYVEPAWDETSYKTALRDVEQMAQQHSLTGRMRVAKEGLNCTLTAVHGRQDMIHFCQALRAWKPEYFLQTEFKLTHHLPTAQAFRDLKVIPVVELVHYGLEGAKAPPIQQYHGTHLEPAEYHKKLAERNTVVIDVRNHYEAAIGHFQPPTSPTTSSSYNDNDDDGKADDDAIKQKKLPPPRYIDPKWRKSTEFPVWLDKPETQEQLKSKQVLMFCTGGIRCERASALLKYKMETDPQFKNLGIQGVYQLQGGIDKYFKEFPDGGYWKGKNYVFDKRFAHAPVDKEAAARGSAPVTTKPDAPMGKCEACGKNWNQFRGKRRCPTCGVPSLICRDCWQADQDGTRKLDRSIRCDLCVEQDIRSKKQLREKEKREIEEYEERSKKRGLLFPAKAVPGMTTEGDNSKVLAPNPDGVTRLFLKNMCRNNMTDDVLIDFLPGITHIVWRTDRKTGQFFGQGWVEMDSPDSAAAAVARSGEKVLGRHLYISFQKPDSKDAWPPPNSAVIRK